MHHRRAGCDFAIDANAHSFGGGEVDEIRWELAGDGLHLFLISTNAPFEQQKAYLETKPWQSVGSL